jgi:hypothetical protein
VITGIIGIIGDKGRKFYSVPPMTPMRSAGTKPRPQRQMGNCDTALDRSNNWGPRAAGHRSNELDDPNAPYAFGQQGVQSMLSKKSRSAPQATKFIGTIGAIGSVAKREEFKTTGHRNSGGP